MDVCITISIKTTFAKIKIARVTVVYSLLCLGQVKKTSFYPSAVIESRTVAIDPIHVGVVSKFSLKVLHGNLCKLVSMSLGPHLNRGIWKLILLKAVNTERVTS
jgi:hypothetical protein